MQNKKLFQNIPTMGILNLLLIEKRIYLWAHNRQ